MTADIFSLAISVFSIFDVNGAGRHQVDVQTESTLSTPGDAFPLRTVFKVGGVGIVYHKVCHNPETTTSAGGGGHNAPVLGVVLEHEFFLCASS